MTSVLKGYSFSEDGNIGENVLQNGDESDIIGTEMMREAGLNEVPSMDEQKYYRIKEEFEKRGGVFFSSPEVDKHLDLLGAEAATLNQNTILVRSDQTPSASAVFEELIHTTQHKKGKVNSTNLVDMEIEAKEKLVRNQTAYGITDAENLITMNQLEELYKLRGG